MSSTMKAVVIDNFVERYEDVKVSTVPKPTPKSNEILIEVKAAGVNFVDTLYARGKHQNNLRHVRPPFTLGLEFSGLILSSPPSSLFKPGDRVLGDFPGCYTQYILYPSHLADTSLHRIPDSWTYAESAGLAATLPVSYGALSLLPIPSQGPADSQPTTSTSNSSSSSSSTRKTILIHAAAGGLGLAAVQIARALGYRVLGTAGSPEKCRIAESFGAEKCINYSASPTWWLDVLALTEDDNEHGTPITIDAKKNGKQTRKKKGVDIVYDPVGLVDASLKCIAHRGKVLVVGFAGRDAGSMEGIKMNRVLLKQASLIGYRFGESLRRYPEEKAKIWSGLWPLIESEKIRPCVYTGRDYLGLESVPAALNDIATRKVWGKAVIQVDAGQETETAQAGAKSKL